MSLYHCDACRRIIIMTCDTRRLDWEIWIHTLPPNSTTAVWLHFSRFRSTAQLEAAALAGHVLPVPVFVDKLIKKILAGDTDAVDLTGTGRALLSSNGSAPTAIKAQYFWFNFSNGSTWWRSSQVSNNPAIVYTQAADRCASAPRQRTLHSLCLSPPPSPLRHASQVAVRPLQPLAPPPHPLRRSGVCRCFCRCGLQQLPQPAASRCSGHVRTGIFTCFRSDVALPCSSSATLVLHEIICCCC